MASVPVRGRSHQRPLASARRRGGRGGPPSSSPRRGGGSAGFPGAGTWLDDYRRDLLRDRSDAPRIPVSGLERLFPEGAPRSWELLVERPQRPGWVLRAASALISVVIGAAALLSPAVAGVVATIVSGLIEMVSIAGHVLGLVGAGGWLGLVGRLATMVVVSISLGRLGWRAARWGVAPIGDDR